MAAQGSIYEGEELTKGSVRTTTDCAVSPGVESNVTNGCFCTVNCNFNGCTESCESTSYYIRPTIDSTLRFTLDDPLVFDAAILRFADAGQFPNTSTDSMNVKALIFPPGTYEMEFHTGDGEQYMTWIYDMEVSSVGYRLANPNTGDPGVTISCSPLLGFASQNYNGFVRNDYPANLWVWKFVGDGPNGTEVGRDCKPCDLSNPDPQDASLCYYYGKNEILELDTNLGDSWLGGVTSIIARLSVEIIKNPEANKNCGVPCSGTKCVNSVGTNSSENIHSDTLILKLQIISITKTVGSGSAGKILLEQCYPCTYWCYRQIFGDNPSSDEFLPLIQTGALPGLTYWTEGSQRLAITFEHNNPLFEG